jgi:hypothetical protein
MLHIGFVRMDFPDQLACMKYLESLPKVLVSSDLRFSVEGRSIGSKINMNYENSVHALWIFLRNV